MDNQVDNRSDDKMKEADSINKLISMREAGEKIGVNRLFLAGYVLASGIPTRRVGSAIAISSQDVERLGREIPEARRSASMPTGTRKRRRVASCNN